MGGLKGRAEADKNLRHFVRKRQFADLPHVILSLSVFSECAPHHQLLTINTVPFQG